MSRGPQDVKKMVDFLVKEGINMVFTIGGDGTFKGAHEMALEVKRRNLSISIIGVPKTIDNDLMWTERSFGFDTAVEVCFFKIVLKLCFSSNLIVYCEGEHRFYFIFFFCLFIDLFIFSGFLKRKQNVH